METHINNELIRSFNPCYNPTEISIPDGESLTVLEWIEKYQNQVKNKENIIWLICRKEFMSDRNIRLFAVWCARKALKLIPEPDPRSIIACDISEKFANDKATKQELFAAWSAARFAAWSAAAKSVAWSAAWSAAGSAAAWPAAWPAAWSAAATAWPAAWSVQIEQLKVYFK